MMVPITGTTVLLSVIRHTGTNTLSRAPNDDTQNEYLDMAYVPLHDTDRSTSIQLGSNPLLVTI